VAHFTQVLEAGRCTRSERRRKDAADERVLRGLGVVGDFRGEAVVEERSVEADLELRGALGLQVRVTERAEHKARLLAALTEYCGGRVVLHCVRGSGLHAGRTVRGAEAKLVDPAGVAEEGL